MVKRRFDPTICDDKANHVKFQTMRRCLQKLTDKDVYKDAFDVMEQAFGPTWRGTKGGFDRVLSHSIMKMNTT